jgi:hypothetical protein
MNGIKRFVAAALTLAVSLMVVGVAFAQTQSFFVTYSLTNQVTVFKLVVQAGTDLEANVICINGSDVDTYMTLYEGDGTYYADNDDGGPIDCPNAYDSYLNETGLAAGTYLLYLYSYGLSEPSDLESGDVQLDITCTPACTITQLSSGKSKPKVEERINSGAVAGPVALYCKGNLLDVYGIDEKGNGFLAFRIATNTDIPDQNKLVKTFENIAAYHLSTGEWQINAGPNAEGKVYVFIFSGCPYQGDGYEASY